MAYGTVKADSITFTSNSADVTTTLSGIYASTTNNLTLTGTASAVTFTATTGNFTSLTGTTTTGTTANFASGVFTTQISGVTITGTTVSTTTGNFTSLTGTTATITSGIIASGTAALPSLAILSDPDTGIYSPGADQVAVATNGTGRLFVGDDGRVGVGGTGIGASIFTARAATNQNITIKSSSGEVALEAINDANNANVPLRYLASQYVFNTGATERLRITSAGLVGLGTSSPSGNLHVYNPATTSADIYLENTDGYYNFKLNNQNFDILEGATSRLRIASGGNVGIGVTSPATTLDVNGDVTITDKIIHGGDTNTAIRFPAADTVSVETAGSERLRITSAGLVGIGTSSPTEKLTIDGNVAFNTNDQYIKFNSFYGSPYTGSMGSILAFNSAYGSEVAAINFYQTGGNVADILFRTGLAGSSVERMRINSSGNVGIGVTSPAPNVGNGATLHLSGATTTTELRLTRGNGTDASITSGSTSGGFGIQSSTHIALSTNGANERLRIDSSGRLLVGTSTARSNFFNSINSSTFHLEGQLNNAATASIVQCYNANTQGATLVLGKSNTLTVGANALVANGDTLGRVSYQGNDGTEFVEAASILAQVDGTPGANDMPGRIVLSTTADGAASPTERMRITSAGNLLIGGTLPSSPNAEIKNSGLITSGGYPITRSFSFLKYSGYGFVSQVLNIDAEINAKLLTGSTGWRQATVTLRGTDGASVGYWHGIYSKDGSVRATELASTGNVTLTVSGGNLTFTGSVVGQWYNTVLTISYTAI